MHGIKSLGFGVLGAALLLTGTAQAVNRALLVGVGHYQSVDSLSGIDIDIDTVRQWAPMLGYTQVEVLQNKQATYANVRAALQKLVSGMNSGDRALFYFSGHGAQFKDTNGDEADGEDEALILHDSTWKGEQAENVLLDDEIGGLIGQIKNGELLMLVDACNSGTVDKSVSNRGLAPLEASASMPAATGEVKGLGYFDIPAQAKSTGAVQKDSNRRDPPATARYVAINAAQDNQLARASINGSFFTLGLNEALQAAKSPPGITPAELRDRAAAFIKANVKPERNQYAPQLQGNSELFAKRLSLASSTGESPHGATWAQFEELLAQYGASGMTLAADPGTPIKIGQWYTLELQLPKDLGGYLSVVAVDSGSEEATVLFPNAWAEETEFKAGASVKLPSPETKNWGLKALPPASKTLIVALVTPEPLALYEKGIRKNRVDPTLKKGEVFARLAPAGLWAAKSVRSTGAEARAAAAKVIIDFQ
ncbi:MAG: caspase family protein [Albidovulum sp.]